MRKNLYVCAPCGAQMIAQAPAEYVTPFMLKCRVCREFAHSKMFLLAQDVLGDAHVEFTYEGVQPGYGPSGVKDLRNVPPAEKKS